MTATLKTTIIQEPSSATANMTLDTSGGVNLGAASTIATIPIVTTTGTQTLTNKTLTSPTLNSPTINTPTMGGSVIVSMGAQTTTSGTAFDFTGIPSWAKKITVLIDGVSTNGTSIPLIQLGDSGGIETSGYAGSADNFQSSPGAVLIGGTGFPTGKNHAATVVMTLVATIYNVTGNTWICSLVGVYENTAQTVAAGGSKTLSGVLDRVRVTTTNGTDAFDAGAINVFYE